MPYRVYMQALEQIFDRALYRQHRQRYAKTFSSHHFLHLIAQTCVIERLDAIDREFSNSLIIGAANNEFSNHPRLKHCIYGDFAAQRLPSSNEHCIVMDEEWLPFQPNSLDAIIAILTIHHTNDVVGVLLQMQRALKPDGLLLVVTSGARSLIELRSAFAQAELVVNGGISPRISPFMEVRDAGALLQRAGFALPVADSEVFNLTYTTINTLYRELLESGEGNILNHRIKEFSSRKMFERVASYYQTHFSDVEGRLQCSAELLFLTGWKPHSSQQLPLARGSGQINLNEVFLNSSDKVK